MKPAARKRLLYFVGFLAIFVVLLVGVALLFSGGGNTLSNNEGASLTGDTRYVTDEFEPAFSFRVGEGWTSGVPAERQEFLGITYGGDSFLSFSNPNRVFDPKEPAAQKKVPAPDTMDGWVAWHQQNPYLEVSDPEPASIDSATGVRFDARLTSIPENYPPGCGEPCVPAYPVGDTQLDFFPGDQEENFVLEVGDEVVTVSITAPADRFEEFLPKAREVLDTVEWEAAS
jgi:hypothetical protein